MLGALLSLSVLGAGILPPEAIKSRAPENTVTVSLGQHFSLEYERAVRPEMSLYLGGINMPGPLEANVRVALGVAF
jgi:hypothetical protein